LSEEDKKIIYENEGSQYELSKFTDEGKTFFRYLIETNQEVVTMKKRIDILQAASITLNSRIKEQLVDDMLLQAEEVAESS